MKDLKAFLFLLILNLGIILTSKTVSADVIDIGTPATLPSCVSWNGTDFMSCSYNFTYQYNISTGLTGSFLYPYMNITITVINNGSTSVPIYTNLTSWVNSVTDPTKWEVWNATNDSVAGNPSNIWLDASSRAIANWTIDMTAGTTQVWYFIFPLNVTTENITSTILQVGDAYVGQQVEWNFTSRIVKNPDANFIVNISIPTWTGYISGTNVSYENSTGSTFPVTTDSKTLWDKANGRFYRWNTTYSTSDTIYFVYFNSTPPTLTSSISWRQNTSVTPNTTTQFIYEEINITNQFSEAAYTNVQWSEACRSYYTCYAVSQGTAGNPNTGTIPSIGATNSVYINISAYGDVLNEVKGPWRQDGTKTTYANGPAYITQQFNITNTDTIDFSSVDVTANITDRSGWTCSEKLTSVNVAGSASPAQWDYAINCTKSNIVLSSDYRIGKIGDFWFQNVSVNNTDPSVNFLTYINSTFKSIAFPGLWYEGSNITSNIFWSDTDNDNYWEYVQWNYTIPANTLYNFTINGTRWVTITTSLSKDWIYTDESTTITGTSKYMDGDVFPDYSPPNITIYVYEHYPFQLVKSYVVNVNSTTKAYSQLISGLLSGVYDIWAEMKDEDNIFAKSPVLGLSVYLRPSFPSISIPLPPPPKAEISIPSLPPGILKVFSIEEAKAGFSKISIEVKNRVVNVKIAIEKLAEKPAGISAPALTVYHYISVTPRNLRDEDIKQAKVEFKVEKTWLAENNITADSVCLLRFSNGEWVKLLTKKIREDEAYVYYEAKTPGFSYFAISGEKVIVAPPAPVCGNGICEAGEDYINCPADCPSPPKCTCTNWSNVGCGITPCKAEEMKQVRSCLPAGCDVEERCVSDPSCVVKPEIPERLIPWRLIIGVVIGVVIIIFLLLVKKIF